MKPSDRLGLEACMTSMGSRQEILADEKVQQELGNQPINGKALIEALRFAAKKQEPNGHHVFCTWAECQNFLDYIDGVSTKTATLHIMAKLIEGSTGPLAKTATFYIMAKLLEGSTADCAETAKLLEGAIAGPLG